ncbi:uncharacterized protein LOC144580187 [Callithrix jacchus]
MKGHIHSEPVIIPFLILNVTQQKRGPDSHKGSHFMQAQNSNVQAGPSSKWESRAKAIGIGGCLPAVPPSPAAGWAGRTRLAFLARSPGVGPRRSSAEPWCLLQRGGGRGEPRRAALGCSFLPTSPAHRRRGRAPEPCPHAAARPGSPVISEQSTVMTESGSDSESKPDQEAKPQEAVGAQGHVGAPGPEPPTEEQQQALEQFAAAAAHSTPVRREVTDKEQESASRAAKQLEYQQLEDDKLS